MILKDNFYTIITQHPTPNTHFQVKFNPEHDIFRVHFVGNPVVPGVCLIQMGTELLEQLLGISLQLVNAVNIKFRLPVKPSMQPTFVFTKVLKENGQLKSVFSIEEENIQYARLSLLYHYSNL